ncbi:hypothetical protein AAFF_G00288040 [Aldrovandia affinis]|uniref:Uncharacterized protein n=1 Tax=Aldrovandia affinis TaxID=143900 RepID=A0AAD7WS90_9TELE|nr:hypothetical protein AAFF_G00288040 [Aldrovandia affinis]
MLAYATSSSAQRAKLQHRQMAGVILSLTVVTCCCTVQKREQRWTCAVVWAIEIQTVSARGCGGTPHWCWGLPPLRLIAQQPLLRAIKCLQSGRPMCAVPQCSSLSWVEPQSGQEAIGILHLDKPT